MLRQAETTWESDWFRAEQAMMIPADSRERITLAVAANGPRTIAIAARADGWATTGPESADVSLGQWQSSIGLIMGRLAGITNAGTHRPPVFNECQRCRDAVMEGQFQGTVCRPRSPEFADCQVFGAYRLRIDPGRDGLPAQGVRGTLEGLLITPCR